MYDASALNYTKEKIDILCPLKLQYFSITSEQRQSINDLNIITVTTLSRDNRTGAVPEANPLSISDLYLEVD
jgi:hypothetical protein